MKSNQQGPAHLQQQIEQEITQHQLSPEQLEQLMRLQTQSAATLVPTGPETKEQHSKPLIAIAACLLIALLAIATQFNLSPPPTNSDAQIASNAAQRVVVEAIAEEVVKNHLKLKPLDIKTQSIVEAQRFFKLLEFSPIHSMQAWQKFALNTDALLGGRYCSIQGVTAAQLRFDSPSKQLRTLYEVPYEQARHGPLPLLKNGEAAIELQHKGLNVRLWQERGLMMVLVSP